MVARAYQVRHSVFLGWSKQDRDLAIWELVRSRQTCGSCGTREAEWLPSEGGDRHAYRAEQHRCPGCEALEYGREQLDRDKAGKGVSVRLVRNERR